MALRRVVLAAGVVTLAACEPALPVIGVGQGDDAARKPPVDIQLISVSDWHGQLDPNVIQGVGNVGGAAVLAAYFDKEREANPNTLVLSAGDGFGASPPLSSFFEEEPAVRAMSAMGFDADGLGNHNFDRGLDHLGKMIDMAEFPYLSANLKGWEGQVDCADPDWCIPGGTLFDVGGITIAVIGVTNPDAQGLTTPGNFGSIEITDPVEAAMETRDLAEEMGAEVFVLLAHMGATGVDAAGQPVGPLMDLAANLYGFDVILGDHTNVPVSTFVNGALVVENKSFGATYARVTFKVDPKNGEIGPRSAAFVTPLADAVTADPEVVALLAPFRAQLATKLDGKIGVAENVFVRGNNVERLGEVAIGNLIADALRTTYGTQIALINGGGIRAPLPSSYAPQDLTLRRGASGYAAGPPYDLVAGDAHTVLPFGNSVVTRNVTGTQLWAALEHGVEAMPNAAGFFPQISGFKFRFNPSQPVGARIVDVTLDGGTPIANDATIYTLATVDFLDVGGDGYTVLAGTNTGSVSRGKMAAVVQAYIESKATIAPTTEGRIVNVMGP